uniref:Methylosome protein WDR77 n=1 Tax=Zonotrichia albicollis TaxID=44394 RepID=A0A8D2MRK0_ZONAL
MVCARGPAGQAALALQQCSPVWHRRGNCGPRPSTAPSSPPRWPSAASGWCRSSWPELRPSSPAGKKRGLQALEARKTSVLQLMLQSGCPWPSLSWVSLSITELSVPVTQVSVPLRPPGAVELWELEENESLIVNKFCKYEHDDIVTSVSVLAGSSQAVSGGRDCCVKVWDIPEQTVLHSYRAHSDAVTCVASCPGKDTVFLSCAEDNRTLLWDTRCPKPATRIVCSACNYLPTSVMWHPQKSDIFVLGDESGTVALVDTKNPDSALSAAVHTQAITGFAFSAHSSPLLASISEDCSVAVLDSDLSEVFRNHSHRDFVKGLSWSPSDDALLTTVGWDHQVLHHTVPLPAGEASGINCVKE